MITLLLRSLSCRLELIFSLRFISSVPNVFSLAHILLSLSRVPQGRLAFTASIVGYTLDAGMALYTEATTSALTASNVNVWHMNPIWVSPEEVLAQRDHLIAKDSVAR